MKKFILLLAIIALGIVSIFLSSCTETKEDKEGYKDIEMVALEGTWDIYLQAGYEGTFVFSHDETFTMRTKRGFISGDMSLSPENEFSYIITFAQDENFIEYEFEDGFLECIWNPEKSEMTNLPLYPETVRLQKR